MQSEITSQLL